MAFLDEFYLTDLEHKGDLKVAPDGDLKDIYGLENLKMALLHRLITYPGSLIHRPNYGVGVQRYLNALSSIDNQRNLAVDIKNQFEQDFRVEEFLGMSVDVNDSQPELIKITVRVKAAGYGEATLDFRPFGETV